jgi:hypothetical protein
MAESAGRDAVLISAAQCRAARAWLNWKQSDLADHSGVGLTAIRDFEAEARRTLRPIRAQLQRTFEDGGVEFPDEQTIRVRSP